MSLKSKYVLKYTVFRILPIFLLISVACMAVVYMSKTSGNNEYIAAIIISSLISLVCITFYIFNISRFLLTIKRREKEYNVKFDNMNEVTLEKFSLWIVCSDKWLICPGRWAMLRSEIQNASIYDVQHEYKSGLIYVVKIKGFDGGKRNIKFKNESDAKYFRKWARTRV